MVLLLIGLTFFGPPLTTMALIVVRTIRHNRSIGYRF